MKITREQEFNSAVIIDYIGEIAESRAVCTESGNPLIHDGGITGEQLTDCVETTRDLEHQDEEVDDVEPLTENELGRLSEDGLSELAECNHLGDRILAALRDVNAPSDLIKWQRSTYTRGVNRHIRDMHLSGQAR
jgi:hypothetical protein